MLGSSAPGGDPFPEVTCAVAAEVTSRFSVRRAGSPHTRAPARVLFLKKNIILLSIFFSSSVQKRFTTKRTLLVPRVSPVGSEWHGIGSGKRRASPLPRRTGRYRGVPARGPCAGLRGGGPARASSVRCCWWCWGARGRPGGFAGNLPGLGQRSCL